MERGETKRPDQTLQKIISGTVHETAIKPPGTPIFKFERGVQSPESSLASSGPSCQQPKQHSSHLLCPFSCVSSPARGSCCLCIAWPGRAPSSMDVAYEEDFNDAFFREVDAAADAAILHSHSKASSIITPGSGGGTSDTFAQQEAAKPLLQATTDYGVVLQPSCLKPTPARRSLKSDVCHLEHEREGSSTQDAAPAVTSSPNWVPRLYRWKVDSISVRDDGSTMTGSAEEMIGKV